MAGNLLLLKNSESPIEGDCEAAGYEKQIKISAADYSQMSSHDHTDGTGTSYASSVNVSVQDLGPWVPLYQQALFHGHDLGDVTITEIGQVVDAASTKSWKKVRDVVLKEAWVEAVAQSWNGIESNTVLTIAFKDVVYSWGDKVAHFNGSEKTS